MSNLKTPGVSVKEVATLPASVAQVATAVPAFIGYTEIDPGEPVKVGSMADFIEAFGGPAQEIEIEMDGFTYEAVAESTTQKFMLYYMMQHYFTNGGGACYVCSAKAYPSSTALADYTTALAAIGRQDEPTLLVLGDAVSALSKANYHSLVVTALQQCNTLQDRFVIIDTYASAGASTDYSDLRGGVGMQYLKYGAAYYPHLDTIISYPDSAMKFVNGTGTADAELTTGTPSLADIIESAAGETAPDTDLSDFLASELDSIREGIGELTITLPPSASIAGIYCAVDRDRGVWKAPANVSVGAATPSVKINDADQGLLNVDATTGKSINAIRTFSGLGTLVWGSRTLAGNDNEWRYVPVRRLYITVEESIKKATEFVVFEPNDANTWTRTKAMIENYLNGLWREGALAGAKPEDAFFVNVGLGETMDAQDILEGRLIIEIGMAAVRPAEFIILKFSHKLQES